MRSKRTKRLHILITAGPTVEYFDSVRFLSNASSGKMGYAIADVAVQAGHRVTLISGPVERHASPKVHLVRVESARDMLRESRRVFARAHAAVFCAAVCDYRPRRTWKLKRPKSKNGITMELVANPDIAATLGRAKRGRITIGFALEDHDGRRHAQRKLMEKRLDGIILNAPQNIGSDMAAGECYAPEMGWMKWPLCTKRQMAYKIVRFLESLASPRRGDTQG
jgi:phosphopantothenoylcysteine decarboxylase/phosphopantothenate--cysteine ligase